MTARQWTREALDAAHPEVKAAGWTWAHRANGSWGARHEESGRRRDVWVSGAGHLVAECSIPMAMPYSIDPPVDVAVAVGLASRGMDSLGAMADALEARADDHARMASETTDTDTRNANVCCGIAVRLCAAMLRRGTVAP